MEDIRRLGMEFGQYVHQAKLFGCVSFQLKGARLAPCKLHPFRWFQLI
jgi:hypothetical protein